MGVADDELAALRRATSTGSTLVALGAATAVSSGLVVWRLQTGQNLEMVDVPGLVSLPAPLAVVALAVLSGATGWAGWAYLHQGQK